MKSWKTKRHEGVCDCTDGLWDEFEGGWAFPHHDKFMGWSAIVFRAWYICIANNQRDRAIRIYDRWPKHVEHGYIILGEG